MCPVETSPLRLYRPRRVSFKNRNDFPFRMELSDIQLDQDISRGHVATLLRVGCFCLLRESCDFGHSSPACLRLALTALARSLAYHPADTTLIPLFTIAAHREMQKHAGHCNNQYACAVYPCLCLSPTHQMNAELNLTFSC